VNKLSTIATLALTATLPWQAVADGTASRDKLEEIVVTSSRVPMPLREIGTSVSVITQQEIAELGFNSLYEILRTQPGVQVSNAGGAGGASSLRIRGEEGYRTMMLLDGIDISDTSSPQVSPRVEQLLSSGIQRVEILRGPQGLMYGADAGGVVSITTLAPKEGFGGELNTEGGRYGTRQFAGNVGGGNQTVDFNLSAADYQTDGFNTRADDTTLRDDDGYENTTVHGRFGWNATEQLRLGLAIHDIDATNDYDECYDSNFDRTDDCRDKYNQQAWRVQANYESGRFNHEVFYSNSDTDREFYSQGVSTFKPEGSLERSGYLGSFTASDELKLVYGVDLEDESMNDGSTDTDRDQQGYYLEYQGGFFDRFFVTAGVRSDDNDDFGTHTSYRLSGAYLIDVSSGELKLKTTYGTGFRAPSLYEVAYNAGPFAYPPAQGTDLSEEKSNGFDVGMSWSNATGLYLETVYFDQTVEDEIYFDLIDYSGYLQSNGNSKSRGIEVVGQLPLVESLWLSSNYTYNKTETNSDSNRIFRPRHLGNLGLNWHPMADRLVLGLYLRVSRDAEGLAGESLDNYEVVDFTASYALLEGLEIYGRVENLLDEDYEEVPTYNTSGAAGYAGLRYAF